MTKDNNKSDKLKSLLIRTISAVFLLGLAFGIIIPGGPVLGYALIAFALVAVFEVCRVVDCHKNGLGISAYIATILMYFIIVFDRKILLLPLIMMLMIVLFMFMVIQYPKYKPEQVAMVFFSVVYAAFGLSFLYQSRMQLENGAYVVWLIFIGASGSDTFAYFTGMLIGKHKAFPKLSPKKTVEGVFGGIVGAVLLGIIYNLCLNYFADVQFLRIWQIALVCVFASIFSMIGDLAASAIKRFYNIKDYGNILPGHGGIMDRFDSIVIVGPIVYYCVKLLELLNVL